MTTPNGKTESATFAVRLPASTSNLGPGFDCFGLALKLFLSIKATIKPRAKEECRVKTTGPRENDALPRNATNLIYRAMSYAAKCEGLTLPPLELVVHNDIPLASGLGSSAAAIVGGIKLSGLITDNDLTDQKIQDYASNFEGHPDNVAATLYGGLVASCVSDSGEIISSRIKWPSEIRAVVVSPHAQLPTHVARAALPRSVTRSDAVYNLQRTALFTVAMLQQRYDLLWDAMRDRLHQPKRSALVPGIAEALALPKETGLLGLALSGAGPSILALVNDRDEEIGSRISKCFATHKIRSTVRVLEVDPDGCLVQ